MLLFFIGGFSRLRVFFAFFWFFSVEFVAWVVRRCLFGVGGGIK